MADPPQPQQGARSALILFPRFTTIVGKGDFTTAPIDAASFGSSQLELWRGDILDATGSTKFRVFLEESLDGVIWQPPAATAKGFDPGANKSSVLSHLFALRWFRARAAIQMDDPLAATPRVTFWLSGLLR